MSDAGDDADVDVDDDYHEHDHIVDDTGKTKDVLYDLGMMVSTRSTRRMRTIMMVVVDNDDADDDSKRDNFDSVYDRNNDEKLFRR
jgi:hypothetical protein